MQINLQTEYLIMCWATLSTLEWHVVHRRMKLKRAVWRITNPLARLLWRTF